MICGLKYKVLRLVCPYILSFLLSIPNTFINALSACIIQNVVLQPVGLFITCRRCFACDVIRSTL